MLFFLILILNVHQGCEIALLCRQSADSRVKMENHIQQRYFMETTHNVNFLSATKMSSLPPETIDLVVTSPPYPMIQMWDEQFSAGSKRIKNALGDYDGPLAFELMHQQLDKIWTQLFRVLKNGAIACINIGDATRKIGDQFRLYPNHARLVSCMLKLGFSMLPAIIWRKQTNAPNKFMGSGMMPPGAYVTLEHEYILIFRKGNIRVFSSDEEKMNRRQSSYFWEERNNWFSDVWMALKGTRQKTNHKDIRSRSGAFPFELAFRLINMFSVYGDLVLDPFLGTGTTLLASMACGRNSVSWELAEEFAQVIDENTDSLIKLASGRIRERVEAHIDFVEDRLKTKGPLKHKSNQYGFPVMTRQESDILLLRPEKIEKKGRCHYKAFYKPLSANGLHPVRFPETNCSGKIMPEHEKNKSPHGRQLTLF